jgi:hypothetical protein
VRVNVLHRIVQKFGKIGQPVLYTFHNDQQPIFYATTVKNCLNYLFGHLDGMSNLNDLMMA